MNSMFSLLFLIGIVHGFHHVADTAADHREFFAADSPMNFAQAEAYCVSKGTHLASIHNDDELQRAIAACKAKNEASTTTTAGCFIGLHQTSEGEPWKNTDGTPCDYGCTGDGVATYGVTPWASTEPNNSGNEDCVNLYDQHGYYFNDFPCSITTNYPLCNQIDITPKIYFASSIEGSYNEVREDCHSQNAELASFTTTEQIIELNTICNTINDPDTDFCYLGFEDIAFDGTFEFIDGTEPFSVLGLWGLGEPGSNADYRCGCIDKYINENPLGDCHCDWPTQLYGICQTDKIDEDDGECGCNTLIYKHKTADHCYVYEAEKGEDCDERELRFTINDDCIDFNQRLNTVYVANSIKSIEFGLNGEKNEYLKRMDVLHRKFKPLIEITFSVREEAWDEQNKLQFKICLNNQAPLVPLIDDIYCESMKIPDFCQLIFGQNPN